MIASPAECYDSHLRHTFGFPMLTASSLSIRGIENTPCVISRSNMKEMWTGNASTSFTQLTFHKMNTTELPCCEGTAFSLLIPEIHSFSLV